MVTALVGLQLGAELYRETGDTDVGVQPVVVREEGLIGGLFEGGYQLLGPLRRDERRQAWSTSAVAESEFTNERAGTCGRRARRPTPSGPFALRGGFDRRRELGELGLPAYHDWTHHRALLRTRKHHGPT